VQRWLTSNKTEMACIARNVFGGMRQPGELSSWRSVIFWLGHHRLSV
jgi:hypothetical protein